MKKFVISWISWYDHELKSEVIEEISEYQALRVALIRLGCDIEGEDFDTSSDLKQFAFDCDGMVNAIEIE